MSEEERPNLKIYNADAPEHTKRPKKIAILGDGNIGMELLKNLTTGGAADHVVIYNRDDKKWNPQGEDAEAKKKKVDGFNFTLDQANIALAQDGNRATGYSYSTDMAAAIKDADIVIVTSGLKRSSPTQTRAELGESNYPMIDQIAKVAKDVNPEANYIIATNPVDMVTQRFQQESGIVANKVMGLSGELDRTRMIQSISHQLKIAPEAIEGGQVIGEHGPNMVPLLSQIKIHQKDGRVEKLTDILRENKEADAEIRAATIKGGERLIPMRGSSDWVGPAAALTKMVREVSAARKGGKAQDIYASVLNEKEGVYTGQRISLNEGGAYKVVDTDISRLSDDEQKAWGKSIETQRSAMAAKGRIAGAA